MLSTVRPSLGIVQVLQIAVFVQELGDRVGMLEENDMGQGWRRVDRGAVDRWYAEEGIATDAAVVPWRDLCWEWCMLG
jgi:hypothetical protein